MKHFVLAIAVLLVFSSCNSDKKDQQTVSYTEVCEGYDAIDLEMLNVIKEIETANKRNYTFLERFRDAQVYWIQYKDRHLRSLYPEDWDLYYRKNYGKQVFNSCKCKELIRLTEMRVKELGWYLEGGPGGQEECPSSWNKKSPQ